MQKVEPRFYRTHMGEGRFKSFSVHYKDSDLWIGVDHQSFSNHLPAFAMKHLIGIRNELEHYLCIHPEFASSFQPLSCTNDAPLLARQMAEAAQKAGTGPMAAVAGAFAESMGKAIEKEFAVKEVVIENGGDIYLSIEKALVLAVYAGTSALSGKVGIEIPPQASPLGVCTSAGTLGPSVSFGKADAVMLACKNTLLADAYATALGNRVKTAADIEKTLALASQETEILSALIVCEEKIGVYGSFPVKPLSVSSLNNEK